MSNPSMEPDAVNPVLAGRYELLRVLGNGSFGRTYLAREREAGRQVAIKVLDPRGAADWKSIELFEREAAVLGTLRHHGVPEVHEVLRHEWEGATASFLVMEYVEGESLAQLIAGGRRLDAAAVLDLFLELLGILDYLHGRVPPVLHRDIKPANIIVRPAGTPALVDFGSVRTMFMGAEEHGSTVAGTYGYMPYEQFMGQATPSSDLYALAATFLHLVTGRPPRDFMTEEGGLSVPADLPGDPRLQAVLARMLRRAPSERFAAARDVKHALLAPRPGTGIAGTRESGGVASVPGAVAQGPAGPGSSVVGVSPGSLRPGASPLEEVVLSQPTPRPIRGPARKLLDQVTPSAMQLMRGSAKRSDRPGFSDYAIVAFFSAVSFGIFPLGFIAIARSRRRRLRRFIRDGHPGLAVINDITTEKGPFDNQVAKVSYEFAVDDVVYRDVDQIRPAVANRWRPGDTIRILYLPDFGHDSVILSSA